jgi:hypothetical protein
MSKENCSNYGSSWCADFECTDCPAEDFEEKKVGDRMMPCAPCKWFHIRAGCLKPDGLICPLTENKEKKSA